MTSRDATTVLGLDWGTTHRRAYALNSAGQPVQEFADSEGALACKDRFPMALEALVQQMDVHPDLVVMSGMVGSASGWQEVAYQDAAAPLEGLPQHLAPVTDPAWAGRCPGDGQNFGSGATQRHSPDGLPRLHPSWRRRVRP